MSIAADIAKALDTHLQSYQAVNIAWPNVHYSPVLNQGYLAPRVSGRNAEAAGAGTDGTILWRGFYDVVIYEPIGDGLNYINTKADAIANHFKKGTTLVSGAASVICEVPTITPEQHMSSWVQIVVRVPWFVHEFPS